MHAHPGPAADRDRDRDRDRGQILVLFALAAVALIGMVGLVLDGGGAMAQRRNEQNAADMAAMAGANAYLNTSGSVATKSSAAVAAARAAATRNGYTDATNRASVAVAVRLKSAGADVTVNVTAPHDNSFARVFGQTTWDVSVTATAIAGVIDTATGAAPWTMSIGAFNPDGTPKFGPGNPQNFGETNGDFPSAERDIAWTDFNGENNVNTNEVGRIIDGQNVITATFQFDQYLGQHNQGNHTALYGEVNTHLAGKDVPIPIVGPGAPNCTSPNTYQDGCFKGWAIFHVVSAQGGSSKAITGYFKSNFKSNLLTVGECTDAQRDAGQCGVIAVTSPFDNYVVKLTN